MSALDLTGDLARRRGRTRRLVSVLLLAVGLAAGAWWYLAQPPAPDEAAAAFAAAWDDGDPGAGPVAPSATAVSASWEEITQGMGEAPAAVSLTAVTPDPEDDATAIAELQVTWTLPGERTWSYDTTAPMTRDDEGWTVAWSAQVAHPELAEGAVLRVRRTTAERADVVSVDGTPLVTAREVIEVGIQPSRIENLDDTVAAVRDVLDLDLDGLEDRIEAADPDHFVTVVTLREPDYDEVRDELQPIPGTVFQRTERVLAPTRDFARATLGQAGPVTAELVEEQPERYQAGDVAGLSGLQRAYDDQLAGRPGLEVVTVPPEDADGDAAEPVTLFTAEAEAGTPVTVTLDEATQRAADEALADQDEFPTVLVAIRVSDGHVLAVANGPASGGLDLALTGRYAPGSTFKVVTTAALIAAGLAPGDTVDCPDRIVADGRPFTNAEDQALGEVPFRTAFANSCNTAFVGLTSDLDPEALRVAATTFGLGHDPALGVDVFTGDVPVTESVTELAASAIGQGRILVSPFAMADVTAAAARGAALTPSLVLDPDREDPAPAALPDPVAEALPDLMRLVVTDGSGSAVADVPGGPVHGKTGTAEYGDQSPPRTHAWFVGWQGDVAFAVLVAETPNAFGGRVAAPIAADFLERLTAG
ncbi:penicillin-binding transpeptidase domain-containing protein [Nitriliruptor alkaliphilus]|uniref:penicillin-binding transpeptidase domain-containing protein n=1 Tax=Nitriliruptor alkaliphilus TaxID=427918 RepID=UPI0006980A9D|nr:penicillin-binding transpeptidase domain-containing protein [Nitriliruptor alkaliphilus]